MSILVVGSVAYDSVITPTAKRDRMLGGSATHFAIAASFFALTKLVGVVGTDFEKEHIELLKSRGVDLAGLEIVEGKTFSYSCRYEDDMNIRTTLSTDLNVFADFNPTIPESYRDTDTVFLANIHPQLQHQVLDQVESPRLVACDTMNLWIDTALEPLLSLLRRVDILIINDQEASMLTGEGHLPKAAGKLLDMGPSRLVIKRGEYGALMFSDQGVFSAPGYPVLEVNDPTGAGDSFAGGFIGSLHREKTMDEAAMRRSVIYGSAMASFSVEEFSLDRLISLTHEELIERVRDFRNLSFFHDPDLD